MARSRKEKYNLIFFLHRMGTERYTLLQILQHQALLGKGSGIMQEVSGSIVNSLFIVFLSVLLVLIIQRFMCIDENSLVIREDRRICELSYYQLLFDPFCTYSVVDNKIPIRVQLSGTDVEISLNWLKIFYIFYTFDINLT